MGSERHMISQKRTNEKTCDAKPKQGSVKESVPRPNDETESDEEDELDDEDSVAVRSTVTIVACPRS